MSQRKIILVVLGAAIFFTGVFGWVLSKASAHHLEQAPVATLCSAIVAGLSFVVALFTIINARRTTEESWLVTYRELHKEFWDNQEIAKVRAWLCCEEAYEKELKPVLIKRNQDNNKGKVTREEYVHLENLDRFCAIMLRLVYVTSEEKAHEHIKAYNKLGYSLWLSSLRNRSEVLQYIENNWKYLYPYVRDAVPH